MYRGECAHCRSLRQNSIHSLGQLERLYNTIYQTKTKLKVNYFACLVLRTRIEKCTDCY